MPSVLLLRWTSILFASVVLAACGGGGGGSSAAPVAAPVAATPPPAPGQTAPAQPAPQTPPPAAPAPALAPAPAPAPNPQLAQPDNLDTTLRALINREGLTGDAARNRTLPNINEPLAALGKKLFFSKSLGGDFDAACVSCHHPALGGSDDLSLPVGIGATDPDRLGSGRTHAATGLPNVPRNSSSVFNMGLFDSGLFWDSRVESFGKEPEANGSRSDIRTPDVAFGAADPNAGDNLPAAQARLPVASDTEMRGTRFEAGNNNAAVRAHLAARIGGYGIGAGELSVNTWLPEFQAAFGAGTAQQLITFDRIAEALAAYERSMNFSNHPFANYVRGNLQVLNDPQKRGAILFLRDQNEGGGGCIDCHSGDRFTDEEPHTVAFPQFGPGKGDGNAHDFGRERESGLAADRYRYQTPSLLNVEVTAPYGHAGAYETLGHVLAHYNNPNGTVTNFFDDGGACTLNQFQNRADCANLYPTSRGSSNAALRKLQQERADNTTEFPNTDLNNGQRADIVAFLNTLTDPCVESRTCLAPWIADTTNQGPDNQQLNARDAEGNLL